MKVGLYASMFGKDRNSFPDIESFINLAYELRLDVIDLRSDVGFEEHGSGYLLQTKMNCLRKGLSVGYLATGGHFVGTGAELEEKVQRGAHRRGRGRLSGGAHGARVLRLHTRGRRGPAPRGGVLPGLLRLRGLAQHRRGPAEPPAAPETAC